MPTLFISNGVVQGQKGGVGSPPPKTPQPDYAVYSSTATLFRVTEALRDVKPTPLSPETVAKIQKIKEDLEKNPANVKRIRPPQNPSMTGPFTDPALDAVVHRPDGVNVVSNPIQNFDGPDMDFGAGLFGGRFAPPDTNGAVGPNHFVITTNSMIQVFNKSGVAAGPAVRISQILPGVPNAADDDGDPIVLYDWMADRWFVAQFNLRFDNQNRMAMHVAVSTTPDPTGTYFAYEFKTNPGRFVDYPHIGVWTDGYYMTSNDFTPPGVAPFLGAGFYVFERAKVLTGDPTAKIIGINGPANDGGYLPTNHQGFTVPPNGTPNLLVTFDSVVFGAPNDLLRIFVLTPNFTNPPASTLVQLPDVVTAAFDARNPDGRADAQQPAPGEGLDSIADRLMHALNFRVLAGGVQSYVLNFTVNVSGVTPSTSATWQGGVRWMELRRNAGTGAITINQQATYAPGAGSGVGRDLWMAGVSQDGEGNIALAASATAPGPTPAALNPTVVYTGRLAGDPANTLPQGEVDALAAVTKGVQTATANRWGDYSSLFTDPADDCTFWGAFEYVDSPTATFDWNTRVFSFKVNPSCVTAPRGTFSGTITNCNTGAPILGAIVETTNPAGLFRVTPVNGTYSITASPGTYQVRASKPGFGAPATGMVTVTAGGNAILNLCLAPTAIIEAGGATIVTEGCSPANGAIDPGETVTVSLCVTNTGSTATTDLQGTLQATGGVTNIQPPNPQSYGVVGVGQTVCRNFTFTASGSCGGTITATLDVDDCTGGTGGCTDLGDLTYTFTLGTQAVAFTQNFDGVTAPNLPAGWTATVVTGPPGTVNWVTSNAGTPAPPADTAPNSAFVPDPAVVTDVVLDTPTIPITTASARLTFRNNFDLESTFDGGVLEIAIGAGAFTDIITAGGTFVTGGYNSVISTAFQSPIGGRNAWSGISGGFTTTTVNLPAAASGQNIRLRFRRATDNSVSQVGWRVDTISITDGFTCCGAGGGGGPCAENFDTVTPPALPTGWTATTAIDCATSDPWATSNAGVPAPPADTPPNAAFVNDPNCISDERLDSPVFNVTSATATVTFRRNNNLENGFDGAVLEVSVNGGAFQDIIAAGGSFAVGGYNGVISVNFGSPIAGRQAWTGNSAGFVTTTVNLPASANGGTIVLRFRRGTDSSVSGQGIRIDTLTSTGTSCGGATCNSITCPANVTQSNDPNQCGAVVNYPAPTTSGQCAAPTCSPASGSFFPVGTTTVTCTTTGPPPRSCTFTVTVVDTQPPTITCPANVTAVAPASCPIATTAVGTFPPPVASDNCPGVTTACVPPSGTPFPVGTTTVTCTATDASGNTATCSFSVTAFNVCLQDDNNPGNRLLVNTFTGQYQFFCGNTVFTGTGKMEGNRPGSCLFGLTHNTAVVRVRANWSTNTKSGDASIQSPPGTERCGIQDRDLSNNSCANAGGPPASVSTGKK
ncbi:MAG TPA: HYR domain-containing protein [Blastocatellia bacterium]|nr:HYR domain-containing protein [Blastocatellia bacterium]